MKVVVSIVNEFVPMWNGNRDLSASEQIVVKHRTPTVEIKERVNPRTFTFNSSGEVQGELEVDRQKVLRAMITSISGLSYAEGEDGTEQKVTSADGLFKAPAVFDALIEELYAHFQELLNSKVGEKN